VEIKLSDISEIKTGLVLNRKKADMSKDKKLYYSVVSVHKGIENPFMDRLSKYKVVNIKHDYEKVARKKNMGESQEILVINY
jgi:hypothetical protein